MKYDKNPKIKVAGDACEGYEQIFQRLNDPAARVVLLDCYNCPALDDFVGRLRAEVGETRTVFDTRDCLKSSAKLEEELSEYLTDDPVFGRVCDKDMDLFFEPELWMKMCRDVKRCEGPQIVVGPGAGLKPLRGYADLLVLAQVPREIVFLSTLRNIGDDVDRTTWGRYKRNFYVDWPVQNKHQFGLLTASDFVLDLSHKDAPRCVVSEDLSRAFEATCDQPFRVRSLFMPGVWGGTRLRELIPDLPEEWPNCAWGFEVVGPENTVTYEVGGVDFSVAFDFFMNQQASRLMGKRHFRKFGDFFPIRFDFLDTIDGTNLSCQVHPDDAYINSHFREPFAQDETYYIMEAVPDAKVYLGLTEDTNHESFLHDVALAKSESVPFEISKHVNEWPAEVGDLFLIPNGTVHCSGAGNLVLEISATPYIYTFKIYDYLRPDLDGKPRPISYERAFEVIDFERKTEWVEDELIVKPKLIAEGTDWKRFLLADHALLFHIIERIEFNGTYSDDTSAEGVHVICLVKGSKAKIRAGDAFELDLAYAETVIIPSGCGAYEVETSEDSQILKCFLR